MIGKLNYRQQRTLAIALFVAAVITAIGITIVPVWAANASRNTQLAELSEKIDRFETIAERDKKLLPRIRSLVQTRRSSGNYLKSNTIAVAGAELQRRVKDIAASNEAQIISTQVLPASEDQGFVRIAIKVRVRGYLPAILNSLYEIETDDVFMFPDKFMLRDRNPQARKQLRPLEAEFELAAYMPEAQDAV